VTKVLSTLNQQTCVKNIFIIPHVHYNIRKYVEGAHKNGKCIHTRTVCEWNSLHNHIRFITSSHRPYHIKQT